MSVIDRLLRSCSRLYAGAAQSQPAPSSDDPSETFVREYQRYPVPPWDLLGQVVEVEKKKNGLGRNEDGNKDCLGDSSIITPPSFLRTPSCAFQD